MIWRLEFTDTEHDLHGLVDTCEAETRALAIHKFRMRNMCSLSDYDDYSISRHVQKTAEVE